MQLEYVTDIKVIGGAESTRDRVYALTTHGEIYSCETDGGVRTTRWHRLQSIPSSLEEEGGKVGNSITIASVNAQGNILLEGGTKEDAWEYLFKEYGVEEGSGVLIPQPGGWVYKEMGKPVPQEGDFMKLL